VVVPGIYFLLRRDRSGAKSDAPVEQNA